MTECLAGAFTFICIYQHCGVNCRLNSQTDSYYDVPRARHNENYVEIYTHVRANFRRRVNMAPPTLCTEANDTCTIGWYCKEGICRRNDGSCDPSMGYDDSALWVRNLGGPGMGIAQFAVPDCWQWALKNQEMFGDLCLDKQGQPLQENHGVVCQEKKCYEKCFDHYPRHLPS